MAVLYSESERSDSTVQSPLADDGTVGVGPLALPCVDHAVAATRVPLPVLQCPVSHFTVSKCPPVITDS